MKKIRITVINLIVALMLVAGAWLMVRKPNTKSDSIFAGFLFTFSVVLTISDIILRVLLPNASSQKLAIIQLLFIVFVVLIIFITRLT